MNHRASVNGTRAVKLDTHAIVERAPLAINDHLSTLSRRWVIREFGNAGDILHICAISTRAED